MPTSSATALVHADESSTPYKPLEVEFHSEAELRGLLDRAYTNRARALSCHTPAADQTVRQLAAQTGMICARRVSDGIAKWVLILPSRMEPGSCG